MTAPWADSNETDASVRAAPSLGLVHELFTLVSTMQTVTARIVEAEAELTANRAELLSRDDAAAVDLIDRSLAAMDLKLPITSEVLPPAPPVI